MLKENDANNNGFNFLFKLYKKVYFYLEPKKKKQIFIVSIFYIISGFGEMFSLAALIPLLSIVSNPEKIWNISIVKEIANFFGIYSPIQLFIPSILLFTVANILSTMIRLLGIWIFERLAASIGAEFSIRAFNSTLNKNYQEIINIDSSKFITGNTIHLNSFVTSLSTTFKISTAIISSLFIIVTMIIASPLVSIITISIFVTIYSLLIKTIQKKLYRSGRIVSKNSVKQIQIIKESLGSIIEIIISQSQKLKVKKFKKLEFETRFINSEVKFLSVLPKYLLETISFCLLASISLVFTLLNEDPYKLITVIAIFALSAQKILPLFQQIYAGLSILKSQSAAALSFLSLIDENEKWKSNNKKDIKFNFRKEISFNNTFFKYKNNTKNTLSNLNISIKKGDKVGIIGQTGSGKTTFINMILGLLKPSSGKILIDNKEIFDNKNIDNLMRWRKGISYVPQKIFLLNGSIADNIIFSEEANNIKLRKIIKAAEISCAAEFINYLPKKYDTEIGEDGVFLSQGQKQRISIARAIYKNPSVLILDEVTSSLDNKTEKKVISSIQKEYEDITIFMVAHRLRTLSMCDYIIHFESGHIKRIIYPENYNELFLKK